MNDSWYLYVVRTAAGRLYTGIATDVERRLAEHRLGRGRGAKALRGRGPLEVVFRRAIGSRAVAQRAEHRLKRLSRASKLAVIESGSTRARLLVALGLDEG